VRSLGSLFGGLICVDTVRFVCKSKYFFLILHRISVKDYVHSKKNKELSIVITIGGGYLDRVSHPCA
jgi:hypothetical protein